MLLDACMKPRRTDEIGPWTTIPQWRKGVWGLATFITMVKPRSRFVYKKTSKEYRTSNLSYEDII
jgi:hypothetical protein